jgi:5-methylcytosine-specific restriction endonuclease McrA
MLRRSFLPPVPEFAIAADLLSRAADAALSGDLDACADYLAQADLRPLRDFAFRVAGPIDPSIHRQSRNPKFEAVPRASRPRMPSAGEQMKVMLRDGFRCRFCESRVIIKDAHRIFTQLLPKQARAGSTNEENHFGLATLTASIDHLVPYSRGGTNDPENLVTACGPCQFGRNQWTLEEVQIENPLNYPPRVDGWDGLTRLLKLKTRRATRRDA